MQAVGDSLLGYYDIDVAGGPPGGTLPPVSQGAPGADGEPERAFSLIVIRVYGPDEVSDRILALYCTERGNEGVPLGVWRISHGPKIQHEMVV